MELLHFYISPGHNFRGHHGGPRGEHSVLELDRIHCVAGRGIEGDRYFDHKPDFKGQITFFTEEHYRTLCEELGHRDRSPSAFRREVQGVRFLGVESCKPCHWMNQAFCPGAEAALQTEADCGRAS